MSLPRGDSDVLRDLLVAEDARVVIEIGPAHGAWALAALISQGQPGEKHVIIDAHRSLFHNVGKGAPLRAQRPLHAARERSQLPTATGDVAVRRRLGVRGA
ncbi:MAG: hypothetical protein ACYCSF_04535 [Acidimicrobiales bacterium]